MRIETSRCSSSGRPPTTIEAMSACTWASTRAMVCGCSADRKFRICRGSAFLRNSNGAFTIVCLRFSMISVARAAPSDASSRACAVARPPACRWLPATTSVANSLSATSVSSLRMVCARTISAVISVTSLSPSSFSTLALCSWPNFSSRIAAFCAPVRFDCGMLGDAVSSAISGVLPCSTRRAMP